MGFHERARELNARGIDIYRIFLREPGVDGRTFEFDFCMTRRLRDDPASHGGLMPLVSATEDWRHKLLREEETTAIYAHRVFRYDVAARGFLEQRFAVPSPPPAWISNEIPVGEPDIQVWPDG